MITSIFMGVWCILSQIAAFQIEDDFWKVLLFMISGVGYFISLEIACNRYEKLKSRIKTLEDKLKDKENTK